MRVGESARPAKKIGLRKIRHRELPFPSLLWFKRKGQAGGAHTREIKKKADVYQREMKIFITALSEGEPRPKRKTIASVPEVRTKKKQEG